MTKKQTAELRRLLKRYEASKNKLGDKLADSMNKLGKLGDKLADSMHSYNASSRALQDVDTFLDKIKDELPDLKRKIKKS